MFHKKIKTRIKVEGMKCKHCSKKVEDALMQLDVIEKVKIELEKKEVVMISKEEVPMKKIKSVIEEVGYQVLD